jgi:tight adherence protein B
VRRQVRALSSHGRITGWTLAALPPALGVLLALVVPAHIRLLFDDPLGRQLLAGGLGLQVIGMLAIRRIVSVNF